jgi:15-cis-phytoene synthase
MTPDRTPDPADVLRAALATEARALHQRLGIPEPAVGGKMLRPLMARAASGPGEPSVEVLRGALAIQMVHEASLLHDDILDDCALRRGEASLAARAGVAAALVQGDHLLTSAYRVAASTGSLAFVECFSRAVERTVAGEKAQARAAGRWLTEAEYREIIAGKSGELFGCAASLAAHLGKDPAAAARDQALGARTGEIYQMVDDFLDLCPSARLGKPPLLDLRQRKWTWPLAESGALAFPDPADASEFDAFVAALFRRERGGAPSPMSRARDRLVARVNALVRDWRAEHPGDELVPGFLASWLASVNETLAREEAAAGKSPGGPGSGVRTESRDREEGVAGGVRGEAMVEVLSDAEAAAAVHGEAAALGGPGGWQASFARHARSFRFAARLFPAEQERLVAGVYAFCRFTDDLVDHAPDPDPRVLEARLGAWTGLVRRAWSHQDTGIPLLDEVLGETARRGVPALYAEELIRGVAMDLEPADYPDMAALRGYSYRVASVVGLWLTELFGTHAPVVLRRAEALGHAMQLTNILRDVGEDWERGRLYLPLDRMAAHGVDRAALGAAVRGGKLPDGWTALMEELLAHAEADYDLAFEAIPALPVFFQRPVAVAARVYAGIHDEIRKNGHDTLTRRAWTRFPTKLRLGGRALLELRRTRRGFTSAGEALRPFAPISPLPPAALRGGP